jgi:hypothetical protein
MTAGAFNFPSTAQRTQCCATENPVSMARQKVEIETEVAPLPFGPSERESVCGTGKELAYFNAGRET